MFINRRVVGTYAVSGCQVSMLYNRTINTVSEIVNVNREISKSKVDFKGDLEYRINLLSLNALS